jgi:metallo-beta-lactamase family protein
MASNATAIFRRHPELFDDETRRSFTEEDGAPLGFSRLRYVSTVDESRALNDRQGPCIILAASGMCEGGRILHHLRHGLGDARNTVLFVGFQAEGTLGRRIVEGAEVVSIYGEPVRRRAEIASLDGFSAHADQSELVSWVGRLEPRPKQVFLVHGEFEAAGVLAERLTEALGVDVHIPALGDRFDLWN